jgi:hypothetical protein
MLEMMIVIVVVAKEFLAEVGVFKGMLVSGMATVTEDQVMELVSGVGVRAEEAD